MPARILPPRPGTLVIRAALKAAGERPLPQAAPAEKNKYAVRFADCMAAELARDLSPRMQGISASAKRTAGAVRGAKQLDVNFSTVASGLLLGISFKSVHIREATGAQRYTHNLKRNEEELRIEASGYHKADLKFFDVESAPPKNGRPPTAANDLKLGAITNGLLTYAQFLEAVYHAYLRRNSAEFSWADAGEEPLVPGETLDLLGDT